MRPKNLPLMVLTGVFFWCSPVSADTSKIDNIAACAGVVIGNGAVDFYMGDEAAFDGAADIAYTAYLSEVFMGQHAANDILIADQILAGNLDKVIAAYNSETFDNAMYEEIVGCYRLLTLQLLDAGQVIVDNQQNWDDIKKTSIGTIKRVLRAG